MLTSRTIVTEHGRNVTAWSDGSVTVDVREQGTGRIVTLPLSPPQQAVPLTIRRLSHERDASHVLLTRRATAYAIMKGIA